MTEDEDETLLMGLALGGDDGLVVTLMGEDHDRRNYPSSSSGSETASRPAGIIRVLAVLALLGIIIWLISLII